ncbi:MAG TPA: alpha/beta hydrolase [Bryobacteraceae bacterium]|nr:alpha/beta hydrolase [Bryobacteraceae bacterium]
MNNFCLAAVTALSLCGILAGAEAPKSAPKAAPGTAKKAATAVKPILNYNIPLWTEGTVPMAKGNGPLDNPFLTVFEPPANKKNGASVIVAPGGSNIMLMYGAEGMDIAEQYNQWGVTAFVLTYRLSPTYNQAARSEDGKRAVQVVRAKAAEMKLDPTKIGFIGFSAGGGLMRPFMVTAGPGDPNATDPVARFSSRPDYLAFVYGAAAGRGVPGENLKDYPPTFIVASQADMGQSMPAAQFFMELTRAGDVAELHLYEKGHHGFGSGFGAPEFEDWMPRLEHFLKMTGFLPTTKLEAKK